MLQLSFVNFRKDTYILVEGKEDTDRFYIIQSGHVKIVHQNEIPGTPPEVLGPGDFIGVISSMSGHSQIETVVAMSDVVAISVKRDQYPELIEKNTPVAMKIIRTFAHRMRVLNETLMKQTLKNSSTEQPVQIYNVAEYYYNQKQYDIAAFAYYQFIKLCKTGPQAEKAMKLFAALRKSSKAVYLESNQDLLRVYPKGTMIMSESQGGADMFIIQDGTVKISKIVDGTEVTLAILKKGDMFGEMALLENKPRSASAIATDDCRLMTINKSNFNQMVATQPQLVSRLTTMLADRLWSMNRQLANSLLGGNPVAKMTDMLALQVEKNRIELKKGTQYQTTLTVEDIATMCGLKKQDQMRHIYSFQNSSLIKINGGKIFIPDCLELVKQAAFYRKQIAKQQATTQK
ncbi:MAG: cyclic nucleotide-binding domain-containing protein [Treponema sp.]|nr:cyclic nucleotide-binding domain-containing protein [Candidatus Treponema equifaecale]